MFVGVKAGRREIEQSIVVEIFHDPAAGHVQAIDTHKVADVSELADVEFGIEIAIQRD